MRDGQVFHGTVKLGNYRRLSDYFNNFEGSFLALYGGEMEGTPGEGAVLLNKNHIAHLRQEDEVF